MIAAALSTPDILVGGAGGSLLWVLLVHGIPLMQKASKGEISWSFQWLAAVGVGGLIAIYMLLGAVAAWLTAATTAKDAVIYGLGWQGVFGHFLKPPDGGL